MQDTEAVPLPGLEPPRTKPAALEEAVRRTIAAMHARGGLDARSAARCALALELAQVITSKRATGRMSTIGNDARVLVELLDKLAPADEASDVDEELKRTMGEWAAIVEELTGHANRNG